MTIPGYVLHPNNYAIHLCSLTHTDHPHHEATAILTMVSASKQAVLLSARWIEDAHGNTLCIAPIHTNLIPCITTGLPICEHPLATSYTYIVRDHAPTPIPTDVHTACEDITNRWRRQASFQTDGLITTIIQAIQHILIDTYPTWSTHGGYLLDDTLYQDYEEAQQQYAYNDTLSVCIAPHLVEGRYILPTPATHAIAEEYKAIERSVRHPNQTDTSICAKPFKDTILYIPPHPSYDSQHARLQTMRAIEHLLPDIRIT